MSAIGTMLVIGVMVIMDFDIVGRVIFNSPLKGVPEIVAVSIAVIVLELDGDMTYIIPVLLSVLTSYITSELIN
jgi:hypothetical protein